MTDRTEDLERAKREAADWAARLNKRVVDSQTLEQFFAWRREPENSEAYEGLDAVWARTAKLAGDADISSAIDEVLNRRPWSARRALPWLAAAMMIALAGLAALFLLAMPESFETGVGEQRVVVLEDGSLVRINTDSRVEARISEKRRELRLERGEAFFEVAHDAARPFVVRVGDTSVTATGTRFDVRRDVGSVHVALSAGGVRVVDGFDPLAAPVDLKPGEALNLGSGRPASPERVDVAALTSWTTGKIQLTDMPLAAALAEVNRYARKKISLDAPAFAGEAVSGTFDVGDTEAFLAAVSAILPLRVATSPDGSRRLVPRT